MSSHRRTQSLDSFPAFGLDGTEDSNDDRFPDFDPTDSRSVPSTPRRRNATRRSGNSSPSTPTTPFSRSRHLSLVPIEEGSPLNTTPSRDRGATAPGLLDPHSPTKASSKVVPTIRFMGKIPQITTSKQVPATYERQWGQMKDPSAKLASDLDRESGDVFSPTATIPPYNGQPLPDPLPPADLVTPEPARTSNIFSSWSPSKPKSRRPSMSSLNAAAGFGDSLVDAETIYITPAAQRPPYPDRRLPAYWEAMITRPQIFFTDDGFCSFDDLTNKAVELFRDPATAPDWKDVIPDIYGAREKEIKAKEMEADPCVLYWKTLVIKADIRRGCGLIVKAAEIVADERKKQALGRTRRQSAQPGDT